MFALPGEREKDLLLKIRRGEGPVYFYLFIYLFVCVRGGVMVIDKICLAH